jgi:hypothetical protein
MKRIFPALPLLMFALVFSFSSVAHENAQAELLVGAVSRSLAPRG